MLKVVYSTDPHSEIDIEGNDADWDDFSQAILHNNCEVICEVIKPRVYKYSAEKIIIRRIEDAKVCISIQADGNILIEGSLENMKRMISYIPTHLPEGEKSTHTHFEYYDYRDSSLSENSVPLILNLIR